MNRICLGLDFDGVLADSSRIKDSLIQRISFDYLSRDNYLKFVQYLKVNCAVTRQHKFKYCETLDPLFPTKEALIRLEKNLLITDIEYEYISPQLLEYLKQFSVYIVSSAPLTDIQRWQSKCSYELVTSSSIYYSVPDKSSVLKQIRRTLDARINRFVYVGDTFSDQKAATSAGWEFIAATQYSVEDWSPVANTLKINRLADLATILV